MSIKKSGHFEDHDPSRFSAANVGSKAQGLDELPTTWTPPFIVVSSEYYETWLAQGRPAYPPKEQIIDIEELEGCIKRLIDKWESSRELHQTQLDGKESQDKLIVRSSASVSGFQARGEFISKKATADASSIKSAIYDIWEQANPIINEGDISNGFAVIVQAKSLEMGSGHLSNERRESRISSNWTLEWESGKSGDEPRITRLASNNEEAASNTEKIESSTAEQLTQVLRKVAAWGQDIDKRCHFEWVWDGNFLWIVQFDRKKTREMPAPGSKWDHAYPGEFSPEFDVLESAHKENYNWDKTNCLKTFSECGLYCPDIHILPGVDLESHLTAGSFSSNLAEDIQELLAAPVVVRTDVRTGDDKEEEFSPRSDVLLTNEDAISFIKETRDRFKDRGLDPSKYCFLIHHFMASRASALARAIPGNPKVSIDGIWGIPDGLNCFPHDSFVVDLNREEIGSKSLNCKDRFLDVNEIGDFYERMAGRPWDWRTSLSDEQLFSIAEKARKIANHENRSLVVMFFVDLGIEKQEGKSIPWFFYTPEVNSDEIFSRSTRWSNTVYEIETQADLARLKELQEEITGRSDALIRFKPTPDCLRDKDFFEDIAQFAASLDVPIELEGSRLSHASYILQRSEAQVRLTTEFNQNSATPRYSKLVRDKIPVKIKSSGEKPRTFQVQSDDVLDYLRIKALEEALEFGYSEDSDDQIAELADLFEIIRSSSSILGYSIDEVRSFADEKRKEKGGFDEGFVLVATEDVPSLQESLSDYEDVHPAPTLPSALFPDRKMKDDLSPTVREGRNKNKIIDAPLTPPQFHGLDNSLEFQFSDIKKELIIKYNGDRMRIFINDIKPKEVSGEQADLNTFTDGRREFRAERTPQFDLDKFNS